MAGLSINDNSPLAQAYWAGDINKCHELAPCRCCCDEHTFEWCEARVWGGCRGQGTPTRNDVEGWAKHYGMSVDEFLNGGRTSV